MWLARRMKKTPAGEAAAEDGVVTLAGGEVAVYAQGERRGLPVYSPGGCCWRPAVDDRVLVLKLGAEGEQCCVAGKLSEPEKALEPGELMLCSRGGASIRLKNDGTVEITGAVKINGADYMPCVCGDANGGGEEGEEESEGET